MSLKSIAYIPSWFVLATLSACVGAPTSASAVELNQDTVRLEGWLSATGEWTLFPMSDFSNYDPYVRDGARCVSLINATDSPRSEYQGLQGKKVVVVGVAIKYDDLSSGNSAADVLLSKKYYKEDVVENYCLREFVFAVSTIKADE